MDAVFQDEGYGDVAAITRCIAIILFIGVFALPAAAQQRCIDLKASRTIQLTGRLTHQVFAGPPNYEDVRKGDRPEPSYVLRLAKPICVVGDEFIDQTTPIDRVQIFPDYDNRNNQTLARALRRFVGKVVAVQGNAPFGAHTGHHHAPLLLPVTNIAIATED